MKLIWVMEIKRISIGYCDIYKNKLKEWQTQDYLVD